MNTELIEAIRDKRLIEIDYEPGTRIIEPHAYGESSQGDELLRAFQTSGASASGEHVDWKLFRIDRIRRAVFLDERFSDPRPGYRQNDKAMKGGIFAQL